MTSRPTDPSPDGTASPAPFFSIVAACCGVEPYIRACLDSVLSQSFGDWEFLAGIETSSDATEAIVRSYADRDPRIRVFTGPRTGSCSVSRNRGIGLARGEYVVFLDGDDWIVPESLRQIHDLIAARPGADLYPCAIQVRDDATGRDLELRDNYPPDAPAELSGSDAILLIHRHKQDNPHPQMQITVFRRAFLLGNSLECVPGLRRQDSEFSPRALFLARRVVPLHVPFYIYRLQPASVGSSARGHGHFHGDWAIILHSLFAFHARVSRDPAFDRRVSECWARQWLSWLFYFWFSPGNVRDIPRARRLETLSSLFADGFGDLHVLVRSASRSRRIASRWVERFVRRPALRRPAEWFFAAYFTLADRGRRRKR